MQFIIRRVPVQGGRVYVAKPGSTNEYTNRLANARHFSTREEAEDSRCPENERVIQVEE